MNILHLLWIVPLSQIADVEPGDPVLGSYFIKITDKLNDWIGSLSGGNSDG